MLARAIPGAFILGMLCTPNALLAGIASSSLRLKGPQKAYAVLVGINTYEDNQNIAPLECPERDAVAMFRALTDSSTGLVETSNAVVLLGSSATRSAIMEAILSRRNQLKANEELIIYWSGHSTYSAEDQEVLLVPYDLRVREGYKNRIALSREILDSVPAEADLIFIGDGSKIGTGFSERIGKISSHVGVLSASKGEEHAMEFEEGSAFTNSLLGVLASPNADLDRDGFISLEEAYVGMYAQVVSGSYGRQHPTAAGARIHRLMLARALLPKHTLQFELPLPEDVIAAGELVINGKRIQVDRPHSTPQQLVLLGDEANGLVGRGVTYVETLKRQYLYWREEQALKYFENPYKKSFAVLVAIDDYDRTKDPLHRGKTGFEARGFMVQRAEELRLALTHLGFFNENIITLYDERATSEAIDNTLKSFWKGGSRETADRVFFYYGGHGGTFDGTGVLITYDFDRSRPTSTGFLMRDLVTRHSENMATHHVLFTIDACASGLAVYRTLGKDHLEFDPHRFQQLSIIRNDTAPKARNFLVAGTEDHPAIWDNGGIFTQALISGLNGDADLNGDRLIQFGELSLYVADEVARRASARNVRQEVQPYILDALGTGKMLFISEERSPVTESGKKQ